MVAKAAARGTPSAARERSEKDRVSCSKALTRVLRHDAGRWNLSLGADGFVSLEEMLTNVPYMKGYTADDVEDVVRSCEKQS